MCFFQNNYHFSHVLLFYSNCEAKIIQTFLKKKTKKKDPVKLMNFDLNYIDDVLSTKNKYIPGNSILKMLQKININWYFILVSCMFALFVLHLHEMFHKLDLICCFNATFKHRFGAFSWRLHFVGGGNRSVWRKLATFDKKTTLIN